MQRVPRYPPLHARLVRREEGPPMYRMLGYADKNNEHSDLCDPPPPGYHGPFSCPRIVPNQQVHFGPGRFGLPSQPLAFTTTYWDDRIPQCNFESRRCHLHHCRVPHDRPEAVIFPEMAVPGSGPHSKFKNSGYQYIEGLPPPRSFDNSTIQWATLNQQPMNSYISCPYSRC